MQQRVLSGRTPVQPARPTPKRARGTGEVSRSELEHGWFLTHLVSKWNHPSGFLCFLSNLDSCHLAPLSDSGESLGL